MSERAPAVPVLPDVPEKPAREEAFGPPASWMLAPELLSGAKRLFLYAFSRDVGDPRDWMRGTELTLPAEREGDDDVLWFDYLSDLGDGQRAMYDVAYVVQDDVWLDAAPGEALGAEAHLPSAAPSDAPPPRTILRRGRMLFLGGDTAYPIADEDAIRRNVQHPFTWAYRELHAAGRMTRDDAPREVTLLGLPGNHDYYDRLEGFSRFIREPVPPSTPDDPRACIELAGFRRVQDASYVAVRLPHDWELWGLDTHGGALDARQRAWFTARPRRRRLIVATPEPSTVLSRTPGPRDTTPRAHADLGLEPAYLHDGELEREEARLDLSGDHHHYARYWGTPDRRYASVVSGLGGAFHHPGDVLHGEIRRQAAFPRDTASRRAVADRLLDTLQIIRGGFIRIVGFFVAVLVVASSVRADSGQGLFHEAAWALGFHGERRVDLDLTTTPAALALDTGVAGLRSGLVFSVVLVLAFLLARVSVRIGAAVTRSLRTTAPRTNVWVRLARYLPSGFLFGDRGYVFLWLLLYIAVALPFVVASILELPRGNTLILNTLLVLVLALLVFGLPVFAFAGAGKLRGARKVPVVLLGVFHVVVQLVTPLVVARVALAQPVNLAVIAGASLAFTFAGRLVARARPRRDGGRLSGTARAALLSALWIGNAAVVAGVPLIFGDGTLLTPAGGWANAAYYVVAGLCGMVLTCRWFGWYLACAWAAGGHVTDAGAAARVDTFAQFIRFRLDSTGLTAWVIGLDAPAVDGAKLRARVVDTFKIETPVRAPSSTRAP